MSIYVAKSPARTLQKLQHETNSVVGDSWQCLWDSKCCSSFLGTLTNWHFSTSQLNQGTPQVHQRKKSQLLSHFCLIYVHLPSQVIVMCKSYIYDSQHQEAFSNVSCNLFDKNCTLTSKFQKVHFLTLFKEGVSHTYFQKKILQRPFAT